MLIELTDYAFGPNGPVRRVLGQHRRLQATIAHEFAEFIDKHRSSNQTTVSLSEQRGGLGKTAAYAIVLMLDISLTGQRAAYATFTRALRDSIKELEPQFNTILRDTMESKGLTYRPVNIVEFQSPTAFISPSKCKAIMVRLQERRIPVMDIPEVQEFLDCVNESEHPCEFADLYAVLPSLPCDWSELSLSLCPADRDTDEWKTVQRRRAETAQNRTLILLTHAMMIRNNLRHGTLFETDNDEQFDVKTLVLDEADKLPAIANTHLRFTISRNEIGMLLQDIRDNCDPTLRAEGERILTTGLEQLDEVLTKTNYSCGKDDPLASTIANILTGINHGFSALTNVASSDALVADRIRLCRDQLRPLARILDFNHPILHIGLVRDPAGQPDINLTMEIGSGRQLINQMWRPDGEHRFETITMASALMTNMPPYATRYDRFRRDIGLDRTKGDHYIERPPLQPPYGGIANIFVADRVPALLPTDAEENNLLRVSSLDGLAAQIITAAKRRRPDERMVVLFQSYIAMTEIFKRLPDEVSARIVMRHRRHLSDAILDFANRRFGIWFGVEWEGINFVHPRTRQTMVNALIITRMPLAPRDEIRIMRLGNAFDNQKRAQGVALFESVHACYRKFWHGVLLGIRNERDIINELWILDPRWPLPAYIYQRQPPQIIRSINGSLFNFFDRVIEPYNVTGWHKVDAQGEITPILIEQAAAD